MNAISQMHILRNPWGHSADLQRAARVWAGNRIEQLERELAEMADMRADAERYQWLRAAWNDLDKHHDIWDSDGTPEGFDAAIDTARNSIPVSVGSTRIDGRGTPLNNANEIETSGETNAA